MIYTTKDVYCETTVCKPTFDFQKQRLILNKVWTQNINTFVLWENLQKVYNVDYIDFLLDTSLTITTVNKTLLNVYWKKSFLSTESDTKILQSIYFAYKVGIISSYSNRTFAIYFLVSAFLYTLLHFLFFLFTLFFSHLFSYIHFCNLFSCPSYG